MNWPAENDDRGTGEVMQTLSADCDRCHEQMMAAIDRGERDSEGNVCSDEYEYQARQFIRAVFAYIEGVAFAIKARAAVQCIHLDIGISDQERFFAIDREFGIDDRGNVVEADAKISLAKNIRFALALIRRACGDPNPFDASVEWWSCLKSAIRIRDRLTHPKFPSDLDVSGDDILTVLKAHHGFTEEMMRFTDRLAPIDETKDSAEAGSSGGND